MNTTIQPNNLEQDLAKKKKIKVPKDSYQIFIGGCHREMTEGNFYLLTLLREPC